MRVISEDRRRYPEGPKEVPDSLLDEDRAQYNHSQSLKRLNERGGMSYAEIYCNIKDLPLNYFLRNPNFNYCKKIELILSMQKEE